jgi:hypothetical protein
MPASAGDHSGKVSIPPNHYNSCRFTIRLPGGRRSTWLPLAHPGVAVKRKAHKFAHEQWQSQQRGTNRMEETGEGEEQCSA